MNRKGKLSAIQSLMARHELPEKAIERSLAIYAKTKNEGILDYWLCFLLGEEAKSRLVDPEGRNQRKASRWAFRVLSDDFDGFTSSQLLKSTEGLIGKIVKLAKNAPIKIARQPALIIGVLEHYLIFQSWPTKSEAAMLADFKFASFCDYEDQDPGENCKKLWNQLCLNWLPHEKHGRPRKGE